MSGQLNFVHRENYGFDSFVDDSSSVLHDAADDDLLDDLQNKRKIHAACTCRLPHRPAPPSCVDMLSFC